MSDNSKDTPLTAVTCGTGTNATNATEAGTLRSRTIQFAASVKEPSPEGSFYKKRTYPVSTPTQPETTTEIAPAEATPPRSQGSKSITKTTMTTRPGNSGPPSPNAATAGTPTQVGFRPTGWGKQ